MHEVSSRRCRRSPVYGRDLIQAVKKISCQQLQQNRLVYTEWWYSLHPSHPHHSLYSLSAILCDTCFPTSLLILLLCSNDDNLLLPYYWLWIGYSTCYNHQTNQLHVSNMSSALREAMPAITSRVKQLDDVIKRCVIIIYI